MEIYIEDGKLILSKYSPLEEMDEIGFMLAGFAKTLRCPILVCDSNKIVQLARSPKEITKGSPVIPELATLIEQRKAMVCTNAENAIYPIVGGSLHALVIQPIITADCDLYGAVILLATPSTQEADDNISLAATMISDAVAEYLNV